MSKAETKDVARASYTDLVAKLGQAILARLNIPAELVRSIDLHLDVTEPVTLTVKRYVIAEGEMDGLQRDVTSLTDSPWRSFTAKKVDMVTEKWELELKGLQDAAAT